ncbi:MAG: MFS transporter [Pseudomonadales bacterium]|nr:MFS transporter [Pseudomonadales bacterium]
MQNKLRRNIQVLYWFSFFWLSMVIIPVIVPLLESKGLELAEVFYLQAFFALAMVIFEIPSGYIADVFGRKNALMAGSVFHALGFCWLNFADGFADLVLFEVAVGIGMSLLSGADLSLLYDSQEALEMSPAEKTHGIAQMRFIKSIAEGVAALAGGFLIAFSMDLTVLANALLACIPFVLTFFMTEAPFVRMEARRPIANLRKVVRHMYVDDKLLRLICLNVTFFSLANFFVVWMLQPYWQDQGVAITEFGLLWAAQSFVVAFASKICQPLEQKFGARRILIAMGILPIVGYFGMSAFGGAIGILLGFCFFISRGINQVILTDALNTRVPGTFRAVANSITSFMFRGVYIVTGPIVGLLISNLGMQYTLAILGALVLVFGAMYLVPLLSAVRGLESDRSDMRVTG